MEIDQLKAFYQLSQDKNYRIAAQHLFITQSALTKKIKRLEERIGIILFERGRNGAELSQAGKMLLPDAKRMIKQFEQFKRFSQCVSDGAQGKLNIGFGISCYLDAPRYISEYKTQYPNVNVTLNDMPSSQQITALFSGDLQLGFSRIQNINYPLQSIKLFSDHLAIAIPQNADVDIDNLWHSISDLNYLQLNPLRGMGLHHQIQSYLIREGQSPVVTQEADDILTLLALVSAGLGYTIIPASAQTICQPSIKLIKLSSPYARWDTGLIWNAENEDRLTRNFIDLITSFSCTSDNV
ncbi:LysR substrate-binding domain-containing protein [Vibrio kasasachensis]|uniref:LysR family transcriptional regulator n=1 Tax=Vibrio kasasachensis TaxID=2910248 RepID=UPI003D0C6910